MDFFSAVKEGKNIFLTGVGGSGKSYLITQLYENINSENENLIFLTSTTGISALSISGQTIHSFSGIGLVNPNDSIIDIYKRVKANKASKENIKNVDILVIDEVSMLSARIFDMLNEIFKKIRKNYDKPFGGVQIILTGDMYQLPPINAQYCFLSETWKELKLNTIYLNGTYRFTDKNYAEILNRIRLAEHTKSDIEILNLRHLAYIDTDFTPFEIKPTILYTTNVNVDASNLAELKKLKTKMYTYESIDTFYENYTEIPEYNLDFLAKEKIMLKIGSQVMITVNINIIEGIVNGSRGVVVSLDSESIQLKLLSGKKIFVERHEYSYKDSKKNIVCSRLQYPIKLAWSITVHKSQSLSIDSVIMDLSYIFTSHQIYVALSRVRSLDGLYLINKIKSEKISVDEDVKKFYMELK